MTRPNAIEVQGLNLLDVYIRAFNIQPTAIIDAGARDCLESEFLCRRYSCPVYAFECNPGTLPLCREKAQHNPSIELIEKAIHEYDGRCNFYPINPAKTVTTWWDGNPGASSLFVANGQYDGIEIYVQDEIEVPCTRLDTALVQYPVLPNVLWMDLQGAELLALRSLGDYLRRLEIICTEVEVNPIYTGQSVFDDIHRHVSADFALVFGNLAARFGTTVIFVNRRLIKS